MANDINEVSGFMAIVCNRWIDEAKGWRCDLEEGHEGQCSTDWRHETPPDRAPNHRPGLACRGDGAGMIDDDRCAMNPLP